MRFLLLSTMISCAAFNYSFANNPLQAKLEEDYTVARSMLIYGAGADAELYLAQQASLESFFQEQKEREELRKVQQASLESFAREEAARKSNTNTSSFADTIKRHAGNFKAGREALDEKVPAIRFATTDAEEEADTKLLILRSLNDQRITGKGTSSNNTTVQAQQLAVPANKRLSFTADERITGKGTSSNNTTVQAQQLAVPANKKLSFTADERITGKGTSSNNTTIQAQQLAVPANKKLSFTADDLNAQSSKLRQTTVTRSKLAVPANKKLSFTADDLKAQSSKLRQTTVTRSKLAVPANKKLSFTADDLKAQSSKLRQTTVTRSKLAVPANKKLSFTADDLNAQSSKLRKGVTLSKKNFKANKKIGKGSVKSKVAFFNQVNLAIKKSSEKATLKVAEAA